MGRTRRSVTKEFKREAVRLIIAGGQSIAEIARGLGLRDTMLGRWQKVCAQDREAAFPGKGQMKPVEAELGRLRRENTRVRLERDIFNIAAALFSKNSL